VLALLSEGAHPLARRGTNPSRFVVAKLTASLSPSVKFERHVELVNWCHMKPEPFAKILTTWQSHLV